MILLIERFLVIGSFLLKSIEFFHNTLTKHFLKEFVNDKSSINKK